MEESSGAFVDVDGGRLYYEVMGTGAGVVALVHGFTLDARMWDDQVPALVERRRVVRYDARGFGRSSVPVEQQPYADADDLLAVLRHTGPRDGERVHVVGLSMGGAIAVDFALTHPGAVRSLTLIGSVLHGFRPPPHLPWPAPGLAQLARSQGVPAAKEAWLRSELFAPALEQPEVGERLRRIVGDYSGWHWLHEDPGVEPEPPAAQRLGEIEAPTLVIVGERDAAVLRAMSDALEAGIPGARKVVVPGVGHMTNMEAPREVNDLILAFLKEMR